MMSLVAAAVIPLSLRYGQKALLVVVLIVFVGSFLALAGIGFLGEEGMADLAAGLSQGVARWWAWLLFAAALAGWAVSYLVARRIHLRQDH